MRATTWTQEPTHREVMQAMMACHVNYYAAQSSAPVAGAAGKITNVVMPAHYTNPDCEALQHAVSMSEAPPKPMSDDDERAMIADVAKRMTTANGKVK
jgi:hypothetical protein